MKWLLRIIGIVFILIVIAILFFLYQSRDRNSGYWLDINHRGNQENPLEIGFSKKLITPEVIDTWIDANDDAQFNPEDGDTYIDVNENGQFDAVYMAGFQNKRPAQGILDDLWARTMVINDGEFVLSYSVLDAIGYGSDDVIAIREIVKSKTNIDYAIIASTHTHQGPDLLGLWGPKDTKSGIDPEYRQFVIEQTAEGIIQAYNNRTKAKLIVTKDPKGAADYVMDTREPIVIDPALRLIQAIDIETNRTIGVLACWSNHPETIWDQNLMLSSDFPHFMREGIEKGVFNGDSLVEEGLGGIAIYANGSIGGLMTTVPDFPITSMVNGEVVTEPSEAKLYAQGSSLAMLSLRALAKSETNDTIVSGPLSVKAQSIELKMDNRLYLLAIGLGVLDRGFSSWKKMRSEIAHWTLGPIEFLHHPAEIYPEIVIGGIESPEGQDYEIEPVEVPPLMSLMSGKYKFVMGLSNDMIGYVIPKSEWDTESPFIYGYDKAPYGEINSLGPETAPNLYKKLVEFMSEK
jgi:hypothetical protein